MHRHSKSQSSHRYERFQILSKDLYYYGYDGAEASDISFFHLNSSLKSWLEKSLDLYLKLSDNGCKRGVLPALLVQQSHVVVKLADVGGVHLQVRTFLYENVRQPLMVAPVTRWT